MPGLEVDAAAGRPPLGVRYLVLQRSARDARRDPLPRPLSRHASSGQRIGRRRLFVADLVEAILQRQADQALERKAGKKFDTPPQNQGRLTERPSSRFVRGRFSAPDRAHAQCAVIGCPWPERTQFRRSRSHTVKTKCRRGASGPANSSQLLLRRPSVEIPCCRRMSSARGSTMPFGWLPALNARNLRPPIEG